MVEIVELEVVKAAGLVEEVCGLQLIKFRVKVVALRNKPKPSEAREDPRDTIVLYFVGRKKAKCQEANNHHYTSSFAESNISLATADYSRS